VVDKQFKKVNCLKKVVFEKIIVISDNLCEKFKPGFETYAGLPEINES
jgi:hypothetical protein